MKCLTGGLDTPTLELGSETMAQCDTEPQISMFVSFLSGHKYSGI